MKKIIIIIALMIIGTGFQAIAQYGFGTNAPNQKAIIDAKQVTDKGVFIPNVALTGSNDVATIAVTGTETSLMVYNTATTTLTGVDAQYNVTPGFYYWNGTKWHRFGAVNWFYMPSVKLDVATGTGKQLDLWDAFNKQFGGTGTPATIGSTGAPSVVPYLYARTDLYYYVTYYDDTAFSNISINENGVMTYDVDGAVTSATFMNVIFVIK